MRIVYGNTLGTTEPFCVDKHPYSIRIADNRDISCHINYTCQKTEKGCQVMAATVQTLLEFVLLNCCYGRQSSPDFKQKAKVVASRFGDLNSFVKASGRQLESLKYVGGKNVGLTPKQIEAIQKIQTADFVDPKLTVQENFCRLLVQFFIQRQLDMIAKLNIVDLNCNPILIKSLRFKTSKEVITYYVFQSISRSMVTSLGYLVQDLLLYSSEDVYSAKDASEGEGTKWDLVKEKVGTVKAWIEVKSGPNDLDKAQILHYKKQIEMIENRGERAFIGETYGKRTQNTITHSLYRQYLPEYEKRTLIGHELWNFISDDPKYHVKLSKMLHSVADIVLAKRSLLDKINEKVVDLTKTFDETYKSVDDFIADLW